MIKISNKRNSRYHKKLQEIHSQFTEASAIIHTCEEKPSKELGKIIKRIKGDLKSLVVQLQKTEDDLKANTVRSKRTLEGRADGLSGGLKLKKEIEAMDRAIAKLGRAEKYSEIALNKAKVELVNAELACLEAIQAKSELDEVIHQ